jgi:hypothetical protein
MKAYPTGCGLGETRRGSEHSISETICDELAEVSHYLRLLLKRPDTNSSPGAPKSGTCSSIQLTRPRVGATGVSNSAKLILPRVGVRPTSNSKKLILPGGHREHFNSAQETGLWSLQWDLSPPETRPRVATKKSQLSPGDLTSGGGRRWRALPAAKLTRPRVWTGDLQ